MLYDVGPTLKNIFFAKYIHSSLMTNKNLNRSYHDILNKVDSKYLNIYTRCTAHIYTMPCILHFSKKILWLRIMVEFSHDKGNEDKNISHMTNSLDRYLIVPLIIRSCTGKL